jgi:4-hydroxybenzoate polyprenyltransferase/phosphoserine phosphatase
VWSGRGFCVILIGLAATDGPLLKRRSADKMVAESSHLTRGSQGQGVPLCVDLDGTLIKSDLLVEGFVRCVKADARYAFFAILWLFRGKAHLKAQIARHASVNVKRLPVSEEFVGWLRAEHGRGRRLVLCTASNEEAAEQVAAHFGIFERTIGSDSSRNLSGRAKAEALEEAYGERGFDYAGNDVKDLFVWDKARKALVVAPSGTLRRRMHKVPRVEKLFLSDKRQTAALWLRQLRLHQWAKNLLILVPAFASHREFEAGVMISSLLAFFWFGLCASASYVVNDLMDLDSDRAHPRKRSRPLASAELPLVQGMVGAGLLLGIAIAGAAVTLGSLFTAVMLFYLVCTLWYSVSLKRIPMVDVLVLAGLYTLRVIAGGAAIAVVPSFWLLAFSMFVFLSLAVAKRYTELRSILTAGRSIAAGRGYTTDDLPLLLSCGTSSGFVSILVLGLYANFGAEELYRYPEALWLLCPLVLYWICRLWVKAYRGHLHDDPVVFAIKDRASLVVAAICAVLVWAAS